MCLVDPACEILACWHVLAHEEDATPCIRTTKLVYSGLRHGGEQPVLMDIEAGQGEEK